MNSLTEPPYVGPIESGIALPASKRGNGSLLAAMKPLQIGQSFETQYTSTAVYRAAKKLGFKVQCRNRGDGYIRAWRIE